MTMGTSMSSCGCNKESSCEDTKQNQNESETNSGNSKDLTVEESKSFVVVMKYHNNLSQMKKILVLVLSHVLRSQTHVAPQIR